MSQRIALNVRGVLFETFEETLSRFPNTLLGNSDLRKPYWNAEREEYYFDRNKHLFDTVLFFYQSGGILAKPECVDEDEFQSELRFFGIIKDRSEINLVKKESFDLKNFLWLLTDYPKSSIISKLFAAFSVTMIVISTITYCLETEIDDLFYWKSSGNELMVIGSIQQNTSFYICETLYVCWFILEYLLRLIGNPTRARFVFSLLGLVDLLSIIPYLFLASKKLDESEAATRTLKFLQIFRILKLSRYSKSLQLLGKSLFYCKGQISLLLLFFLINCLACGSVLYWVERTVYPASNTSLMDTIWFCIVSMTTVGYGDIVPHTSLGKLVGAITILVGIIVLFHIFIPVYLSYFALLYEISVLQALESSDNEKELSSQDAEDFKMHRRKSISSSVRKSQASVVMTRSPSVCGKDNVSTGRKQSVIIKEETAMRRIKYDYLKKISSSESPLTMSQRSLESSSTEAPFLLTKGSLQKKILDSSNDIPEKEGYVFKYVSKSFGQTAENERQKAVRVRREAVYEQPMLMPQDADDASFNNRKKRSFSLRLPEPVSWDEKLRKLSLSYNDEISETAARKTTSLQLFYLNDHE